MLSSATPVGLTPDQIRHAYGIDHITFGNGSIVGNGAGQIIAIVSAYDNPRLVNSTSANFGSSDLAMFDQQFGIVDPPSFEKLTDYGGIPNWPSNPAWANESALDVEWVHALAPKAKILLIETERPEFLAHAAAFARSWTGVSVVSMSFGSQLLLDNARTDTIFTTPTGHNGVTFVASKGDLTFGGNYPASSPNVVSVGGTALTLANGEYAGETGWGTTDGSISTFVSKPAYQALLTQSATQRTVPDVSFVADPNTGPAVYDSFNNGSDTPWTVSAGTSFAAPAWAALIAVANQGRVAAGLETLDGVSQTLPYLYQLPSTDFHDITTGDGAAPGYDLVAGLGSPVANLLVGDLATTSTTQLSGNVFNDADRDGDAGLYEPGLKGWTVYIDADNDGQLDHGEQSTLTDDVGNYVFSNLPTGDYIVREVAPADWSLTTPSPAPIHLIHGHAVAGINFANADHTYSISGTVFNDVSGDGEQQDDEPPLQGFKAYLDANGDHSLDDGETAATTDDAGHYSLVGLKSGNASLRIEAKNGWVTVAPSSGYSMRDGTVPLTLDPVVRATTVDFALTQGSVINGLVYPDLNANGKYDRLADGGWLVRTKSVRGSKW